MSETEVKNDILVDVSQGDTRLFKFQCGKFELTDNRGWIQVGIPGMSDLQGWASVVVTPGMVGKRIAIYTSIEVKTPDGRTDKARLEKQKTWISVVDRAGGIAGFAKSSLDAKRLIAAFVEWLEA